MTIRLTLHPLGLIWIKDYEKPIQCLSLLRLHISRSVKASFHRSWISDALIVLKPLQLS